MILLLSLPPDCPSESVEFPPTNVQRYECLQTKCERALSSSNVLSAQESFTECRDLIGELLKYASPPSAAVSGTGTSNSALAACASGAPASPSARTYSNAPPQTAGASAHKSVAAATSSSSSSSGPPADVPWPHLAPATVHLCEPTHALRTLMARLRAQFQCLDDSINIRIYDNVEQSGDPVELVEKLKDHTYAHTHTRPNRNWSAICK